MPIFEGKIGSVEELQFSPGGQHLANGGMWRGPEFLTQTDAINRLLTGWHAHGLRERYRQGRRLGCRSVKEASAGFGGGAILW